MAAETSQTLDRGVRLLQLVASTSTGYSVSELAGTLGLNRTVVYRLVATLDQHGLTARGTGGRVTAGLALFRLGQSVQPVLQAKATPVLRALADEVGATAHLTIADGEEAIAVVVVEPRWTDYHVAYRVGARHHVREAAAGKAIELGRTGDRVGNEPAYASSVGELQPGAHGIAAPVLGVEGLEASVGLVSLHGLDEPEVGPRVVTAARALGRALGRP